MFCFIPSIENAITTFAPCNFWIFEAQINYTFEGIEHFLLKNDRKSRNFVTLFTTLLQFFQLFFEKELGKTGYKSISILSFLNKNCFITSKLQLTGTTKFQRAKAVTAF